MFQQNGQLKDLLTVLEVSDALSAEAKLQALRSISEDDLVASSSEAQNVQLRAVTDESFIHSDMVKEIYGRNVCRHL